MFTIVRRIHLYAGVILMTFVLMYFVTGFVMVHEAWFPRRPTQTINRTAPLTYSLSDLPTADPQAAAAFVKQALAIAGQPNPQQKAPSKAGEPWRFSFAKPGDNTQVTINVPKPPATTAGRPGDGSATRPSQATSATASSPAQSEIAAVTQPATINTTAKITENHFGVAGTMNGLHRLRGFSGGWKYELWSIVFDASAVSLILFSISGIYLWYKLSKTKWPGVLALAIGLGFTVGTYIYLAVAR